MGKVDTPRTDAPETYPDCYGVALRTRFAGEPH